MPEGRGRSAIAVADRASERRVVGQRDGMLGLVRSEGPRRRRGGSSGTARVCQVQVSWQSGVLATLVSFEYAGRDCGWRASGKSSAFVDLTSQFPCSYPVLLFTPLQLPDLAAGRVIDVMADVCDVGYESEANALSLPGGATSGSPCTIVVSLSDGTVLSTTVQYQGGGAPGCCEWLNVIDSTRSRRSMAARPRARAEARREAPRAATFSWTAPRTPDLHPPERQESPKTVMV